MELAEDTGWPLSDHPRISSEVKALHAIVLTPSYANVGGSDCPCSEQDLLIQRLVWYGKKYIKHIHYYRMQLFTVMYATKL